MCATFRQMLVYQLSMSQKKPRKRDRRSKPAAPPVENGAAKPRSGAPASGWLSVRLDCWSLPPHGFSGRTRSLCSRERQKLPSWLRTTSAPRLAPDVTRANTPLGRDRSIKRRCRKRPIAACSVILTPQSSTTLELPRRSSSATANSSSTPTVPTAALLIIEIKYTFGVAPLQQYLIAFPDGRLQGLTIAWDARPTQQGGQRWFHLYPDERITHDDELHWTRAAQNWNFMCADCHSTDVRKNYDAATNKFQTQWSEIHVGCEACHGPGSQHLSWAKSQSPPPFSKGEAGSKGLAVQLTERRGVRLAAQPDQWEFNALHAARQRARDRGLRPMSRPARPACRRIPSRQTFP